MHCRSRSKRWWGGTGGRDTWKRRSITESGEEEVVGRDIQGEEIHARVGVRGEEHEEGRNVAEVHGRKKQEGMGRTRRYMEE